MHPRAKHLIDSLELIPHPEGGYFKEVYRSSQNVASPTHGEQRNAMTDIYFLLTAGEVSRLHQVSHDEIWNLYEGAPLHLIELDAQCNQQQKITLSGKLLPPQYKHTIQAENWQAAKSSGEFSLVGCTVAPGFDFADFKFVTDNPELESKVRELHPDLAEFV